MIQTLWRHSQKFTKKACFSVVNANFFRLCHKLFYKALITWIFYEAFLAHSESAWGQSESHEKPPRVSQKYKATRTTWINFSSKGPTKTRNHQRMTLQHSSRFFAMKLVLLHPSHFKIIFPFLLSLVIQFLVVIIILDLTSRVID